MGSIRLYSSQGTPLVSIEGVEEADGVVLRVRVKKNCTRPKDGISNDLRQEEDGLGFGEIT